MSPWQRFKNWLHAKTKPELHSIEELREFVYLDDISVDSLVASARGSILDQITQTTGTEILSERAATASANFQVAKGEARARRQTTTTEGLQTLRRAEIQARFRELRHIVDDRLVLRPLDVSDKLPQITSLADVRTLAAQTGPKWVTPVANLLRGEVVEIEVELGTEPLFHLTSALSHFLDLWPQDPKLAGLEELPDRGQAKEASKMITQMLGDLVPIRSRAIDFAVVSLDGEPWLMHHKVLSQLPPKLVAAQRNLDIVGVTAEDRFWKEHRRVLFTGARYKILARIVADGVALSWSPVKMVDTFKALAPEFATAIDDLTRQGQELLTGHESPVEPPRVTSADEVPASRILVETYGRMLGEHVGVTVTAKDLANNGLTADIGDKLPSYEDLPEFLRPTTERVQELADATLDSVLVSNTRIDAHRKVAHRTQASEEEAQPRGQVGNASVPQHLEVEFIAVYW